MHACSLDKLKAFGAEYKPEIQPHNVNKQPHKFKSKNKNPKQKMIRGKKNQQSSTDHILVKKPP